MAVVGCNLAIMSRVSVQAMVNVFRDNVDVAMLQAQAKAQELAAQSQQQPAHNQAYPHAPPQQQPHYTY